MDDTRLPTRVTNACERCRRQKQRCDKSRPCRNCAKANQACMDAESASQARDPRPAKKARNATSSSSTFEPNGHNGWSLSPPPLASQRRSQQHTPGSAISDYSGREPFLVAEFGSSRSAMDITRRVLQSYPSQESGERQTFAIPGGDSHTQASSHGLYHNIADLIGIDLPPKATCDALIETYFYTVHWFSLVVYEPVFQQRYEAIMSGGVAVQADRSFLLLLLMVLAMSCHYGQSLNTSALPKSSELVSLRAKFLRVVRHNFMDLLDEESLEFIQICILLGSYWLYWGKPRSSFSILGAVVKSAQAISLHRQADWRLAEQTQHAVEERKRIWWTIYTWDRFATIVYGRPVAIRDKDCDVQMPAVFAEHLTEFRNTAAANVELSPYQTSLNSVYQIASPLLENIYGIRNSGDSSLYDMAETVRHVYQAMLSWRSGLPSSLDITRDADIDDSSDLGTQLHHLQSLSLQLTYLNLKIIIHRPLLADWSQRRMHDARTQSPKDNDHIHQNELKDSERQVSDDNFQHCLTAALEVSQIERKRPNLVRLASKTHLLSFLAMNIFTSSVVLYICALSDVLSNAAQEAKRGISNNLRLLRSLSSLGSLSSQCSMIIEDLVQMILERERLHILQPPTLEGQQDVENVPQTAWADDRNSSDGMPGPSVSRSRNDNTGLSSRRSSHANTYAESIGAGGPVSLEQTVEQLQRVLKDVSQSRPHQPTHRPPNVDDQSGIGTADPSCKSPGSNSMSFDSGQFLPAQDMGQFWLWETYPSSLGLPDVGNFGFNAP